MTAIGAGNVFVSPITVWEITRKIALGKLECPAPPGFGGSLSEWLRRAGYRILPLTWDACERANALPMYHKDPMDRMLIAAALERGMTVITDNEIFGQYGVATLW
jgi:PIN domain nuclease of toxin-antitoxin system